MAQRRVKSKSLQVVAQPVLRLWRRSSTSIHRCVGGFVLVLRPTPRDPPPPPETGRAHFERPSPARLTRSAGRGTGVLKHAAPPADGVLSGPSESLDTSRLAQRGCFEKLPRALSCDCDACQAIRATTYTGRNGRIKRKGPANGESTGHAH